jgi:hypothetical protein
LDVLWTGRRRRPLSIVGATAFVVGRPAGDGALVEPLQAALTVLLSMAVRRRTAV